MRQPGFLTSLCLVALLSVMATSSPLVLVSRARADASEQCAASYENAQLFRMRARYVEAREALLVCLQTACPKVLRSDCETWLPQVEASLPSLVFAITDTQGRDVPDARVYANGKLLDARADGRALPIDPGVYELRIEAPHHRPEAQTLTVREAEKNRMVRARLAPLDERAQKLDSPTGAGVIANEVALPREKKRVDIPVSTYALGGGAVAGLALFTGFAVAGKREHTRLEERCAPECSDDSTKAGRRNYILADVFLGVSIVSAGAAVWTYFAHRKKRSPTQPDVGVSAGRESVALTYSSRF